MDKKCLLALVQSCHKPTCMIRYSSEAKKKKKVVGEVKHDIFSLHQHFRWTDICALVL